MYQLWLVFISLGSFSLGLCLGLLGLYQFGLAWALSAWACLGLLGLYQLGLAWALSAWACLGFISLGLSAFISFNKGLTCELRC